MKIAIMEEVLMKLSEIDEKCGSLCKDVDDLMSIQSETGRARSRSPV